MATQIAATPVIKGAEATKILKEANRKPTKESEKGVKKLSEEHLPMADAFSCIETPEILTSYSAKKRRRVLQHFLKSNHLLSQRPNIQYFSLLNIQNLCYTTNCVIVVFE